MWDCSNIVKCYIIATYLHNSTCELVAIQLSVISQQPSTQFNVRDCIFLYFLGMLLLSFRVHTVEINVGEYLIYRKLVILYRAQHSIIRMVVYELEGLSTKTDSNACNTHIFRPFLHK